MTALGLDEDDAGGTLGTVECGGVLQDSNLADVLGIDVKQQVGVVAIVERRARLLHVLHNAVDDYQRLCIGIQRTETADEHGSTVAGTSRAGDAADVGAHQLLDVGLDGLRGGVLNIGRRGSHDGRGIVVHGLEFVAQHLDGELRTLTAQTDVLAQELRCMDVECRGKRRDLDDERTVLFGHGRVVLIVQRLYHDTCQGLLGGSINTLALDLDGWVSRNLDRLLLVDDLDIVVVIHVIILCVRRHTQAEHAENGEIKNMLSFHFHSVLRVRLNRCLCRICSQDAP